MGRAILSGAIVEYIILNGLTLEIMDCYYRNWKRLYELS